MRPSRRTLWLVLKTALAVAIVVGVGRYFDKVLRDPELAAHPLHVDWPLLVPGGLLYLGAHTLWGSFWVRLLRSQGVRVGYGVGLRTYFVSQFGKYVPLKAWVIVMRIGILRPRGADPLVVGVTATYETLTSMAAGAMIGVLFLPWLGAVPGLSGKELLLVGVAAVPVGIGLLNKLAVRVASRKRGPDARPLPSPPIRLLVQGLLQAACGWCLLGVSLGLAVRAVAPDPPAWTGGVFLGDLAAAALSYVAGFVTLVAPGGIGAREYVLQQALAPRFDAALGPHRAAALAVVIALVLRLTWTVAEVVVAGGLYFWRPAPPPVAAVPAGPEPPHA